MSFVHLDCYSDYTLGESVIGINDLAEFAENEPSRAIAITDLNNLFGLVHFYLTTRKRQIKPIIGAAFHLEWKNEYQRIILLCTNNQSYKNLLKLVTEVHLENSSTSKQPTLTNQLLQQYSESLIIIVDGAGTLLSQMLAHGKIAEAGELIDNLTSIFKDRSYFAVQRIGRSDEEAFLEAMLEIAKMKDLALVATNPARFITDKGKELVEIRYAIEHSLKVAQTRSNKYFFDGQYLRSSQAMEELFADLPQLLTNSIEIAKRCNVTIDIGRALLPIFNQDSSSTQAKLLRKLTTEGLESRLEEVIKDKQKRKEYTERLQYELEIIHSKGFTSYFLIVHEFIEWAHNNGVSVGPGRGSVAGSLVAYCLKITDIDPMPYGLFFERFLNPERESMPDIDIDFCIHNRERVFQHVVERYGENAVAKIITFGRLRPRQAIRDVTRVLGYPHGMGDRIARMIPEQPEMTFEKAFKGSQELNDCYQNEEESKQIIDLAKQLENKARNIGKHAAGVVIAPGEITQYVPLYQVRGQEELLTQFYKEDLDAIGLVKFDFLGLDTLTTIDHALELIQKHYNKTIEFANTVFNDKQAYQILQKGDTVGVFQTESQGMRKHLRNLYPTTFEDVIAMLALYRPGPMDYIEDFIKRKHGEEPIEYPHESLKEILAPTYGIAVYQEQVMTIAQQLAGYSLGEADILRRAMGKKKAELMEEHTQIFVQRAKEKGVKEEDAEKVSKFIYKFAEYGFNKSHSAAYAILTYRTAWLKAHYPLAFYASMMSSVVNNTTKLNILYKDCKKHNISIIPPHVNHSTAEFSIRENSLVFGLLAIKGVGKALVEALIKERELAPYNNLFDFAQRVDRALLNKTSLEALICAGAFDGLEMSRAELHANVDQALRLADQVRTNYTQGIGDLFGGITNKQIMRPDHQYVSVWSTEDMLEREKKALGFYLTSHPFESYKDNFKPMISHSLEQATELTKKQLVRLAGTVIDMRDRHTKRGKEKLFCLEDGVHLVEGRVNERNEHCYNKIREGVSLLCTGDIRYDSFVDEMVLGVKSCHNYLEAQSSFATSIKIHFARGVNNKEAITSLREYLSRHLHPQGVEIIIEIYKEGTITEIALAEHWRVGLSPKLLEEFSQHCPFARLELVFDIRNAELTYH